MVSSRAAGKLHEKRIPSLRCGMEIQRSSRSDQDTKQALAAEIEQVDFVERVAEKAGAEALEFLD